MAIPDFQSLMLPLLKITGDGNEHSTSEVIETLAQQFGLDENDRDEMLPSGKQRKLDNRVNWTKTYLQKALLLSSTGRSRFRITDRGITVLKNNPLSINVKFLNQFPEFFAFHTATNSKEGKTNGNTSASQEIIEKTSQTPQEILEISYQNLRQTLAQELLERIKNNSPKFFESLVVDLLVAMAMVALEKTLVKPLVRLEMVALMALSKKISLAWMRSISKQSDGKERLAVR